MICKTRQETTEYNSPKLMFTHMQSHARTLGDVLRGSTGSSVLSNNPIRDFRSWRSSIPSCTNACYYLILLYEHLLATMPDPSESRFASSTHTAEDLLKEQTVGLVHYSDFRKRRAEALELTGGAGSGSGESTPGNASRYVFLFLVV